MHNSFRFAVATACTGLALFAQLAAGQPSADQQRFRALYKELVEINTTDSVGSCTAAAQAMAARLKAGGIPAADIHLLVPPGAPKKGNLVVRYKGTGAKKPMLLLAHIDVVEAKREDWQRDPFKLVEEGGYFYARGAFDDKAMASIFVHNLIRYHAEGYRPQRDIVLALTCDEEIIPSPYNGVEYLLKNHRPLIDAEFALNEGGTGLRDRAGKPLRLNVQAGEKVFETYTLETTNHGGHSAVPVKDNAIYHLAGGLARLAAFDFPFKLSEATRAYFERMAKLETGQAAADMQAILREPPDPEAMARLSRDPAFNATFRTTCVATMLEGGHATNALPQRARATVNCRILPSDPVEEVQRTLVRVLADDKISVTPVGEPTLSPAPPLTREILAPVEQVAGQMWPGVPIVPTMLVAATDGRFLNNAGIYTYGISGLFRDPDGSGVHGLNERIPVDSLYGGLEFLYRVVKVYGGG
ncbi:MAG TPA: M20/M25/M40 family metallo-hydrolase [Burkholderiales bacterium]|jgi:acetylornithine deacetylase/succinyl-diaminopimelate desuccinylase-like protein|nr:M20/M25/M40 family metallo-hydrolase [Burkholderiales bacterium]